MVNRLPSSPAGGDGSRVRLTTCRAPSAGSTCEGSFAASGASSMSVSTLESSWPKLLRLSLVRSLLGCSIPSAEGRTSITNSWAPSYALSRASNHSLRLSVIVVAIDVPFDRLVVGGDAFISSDSREPCSSGTSSSSSAVEGRD